MKALLPLLCLLLIAFHVGNADYYVTYDYFGRECTSKCDTQVKGRHAIIGKIVGASKYNYCYVDSKNTWGYCSPSAATTSYFKTCKGPCGKHDSKYNWCETEEGIWDYCSPPAISKPGTRFFDADGFVCKDECKIPEVGKNSMCKSDNDHKWGYCSTQENTASNGNACKDTSPCSRIHGDKVHTYNWCYTVGGGWDYCGDMVYNISSPITRQRRGASTPAYTLVTATKSQNGQYLQLFTRNKIPNFMRPGKKDKTDASEVINKFTARDTYDNRKSHLIDTNPKNKEIGFRIDIQDPAKDVNGQMWTNLQVQKNGVRKGHTTVAQIFFKKGSNPLTRDLRSALELSLKDQKIVCMQISNNRDEPCPLG